MTQPVRAYEPPRGGALSRKVLSTLLRLHTTFADKAEMELSGKWGLRIGLEARGVQVTSVEKQNTDPPRIKVGVTVTPGEGRGWMKLDIALAQSLLDGIFGGTGRPKSGTSDVTAVERRLAEGFLAGVLSRVNGLWETFGECVFTLQSQTGSLRADESFLTLTFRVTIGDTTGGMELALPVSFAKTLAKNLEKAGDDSPLLVDDPKMHPILRRKMETVIVPVRACIAEPVFSLREMSGLEPGDVLNIGRVESEVPVCAANVKVFRGQPGVHNGRWAVRIMGLISSNERRNAS